MPEQDKKAVWPGWETVRLIGRGSASSVYEIERNFLGQKEKAALRHISIPLNSDYIRELKEEGLDEESIQSLFSGYLKKIIQSFQTIQSAINECANFIHYDDLNIIRRDDSIGWDIFIKMELLTTLPKAFEKTVTEEQVIKVASDICNALVFCEKQNLVHGDIKPLNIFASSDGTYKLGDAGVGKLIYDGPMPGVRYYIAPEAYHNQPYGSTADIYSLGLVLYWLLNERRLPFLPLPPEKPKLAEREEAHARRFGGEPIPAPVHASPELQRIVLKACAYDPKDRYQHAEEMLRDLEQLKTNGSDYIPYIPITHERYIRYMNKTETDPLSFCRFFQEYVRNKKTGHLDSTYGVSFPIGYDETGDLEELELGYKHACIGGESGSGKSSFLLACVLSVALHYSPEDLEIWIYGPNSSDYKALMDAAIPHVKKIETGRDDLLSVAARDLSEEMERRSDRFQLLECAGYQDYRKSSNYQDLPRILVLFDDAQFSVRVDHEKEERMLQEVLRTAHGVGFNCIFTSQLLDLNRYPFVGFESFLQIRMTMKNHEGREKLFDFFRRPDSINAGILEEETKKLAPGMFLFLSDQSGSEEKLKLCNCLEVREDDFAAAEEYLRINSI